MGVLRAIGIAFLALLAVLLLLGFVGYLYYVNQLNQPKPVLAMNWPAGITYKGPDTTALAGYYCIENMNSNNGYGIQLNAELDNGVWVQDVYIVAPDGQSGFNVNVWSGSSTVSARFVPANAPCAWLVITIKGGYVYVGYSLDSENIIWYASYSVGATYIVPDTRTNLVTAGYAYGIQAQLNNGTLIYLALYYWNGTAWVPAPVGINQGLGGTQETVNHAWEFTSGSCGGYVAWFGWNKTNPESPVLPSNLEPVCPTPPGFSP